MSAPNRMIFASDFDNTLYFFDLETRMHREDLEAIWRFRQQGNLFGVATGRSLKGIEMTLDDLRPTFGDDLLQPDFLILASGALIVDRNRAPLYRRCVDPSLIVSLNDEYAASCPIIIHGNDTAYSLGEPLPMQTHIDSVFEIGPHVYGISMHAGTTRNAHSIAAQINERYGRQLVAYANQRNVDVAPLGCSKGHALKVVAEHFGAQAIAAIGDSFNDVPMLEAADISFTFNRSPHDVREHAQHLVDTVAEALKICMREGGAAR